MDLTSFIREELHRGMSERDVREFAISRGYSPLAVDRALRDAQTTSVKHIVHFSPTTLVAVLLILIGVGGASFAVYYFFPSSSVGLLDVSSTVPSSVQVGGMLSVSTVLSNLGSKERFDVAVVQELVDRNGEIITFTEESVAVETRASVQMSVAIPLDSLGGRYTLRTTARYEGRTATAANPVTVLAEDTDEPEQPIDQVQNCPICNDNDVCTRDLCSEDTGYQCRYEIITPCCGNEICEPGESYDSCSLDCPAPIDPGDTDDLDPWEKVEAVKQLTGDPEAAGALCSSITEAVYRDECFAILGGATAFLGNCDQISNDRMKGQCYIDAAVTKEDSSICDQLTVESRRDACYVEFYTKLDDFSVCPKIVNEYLRILCDGLAQA